MIGDLHSALITLTSNAVDTDTYAATINDPKNGESWTNSVINESEHFKNQGSFTYDDQTKVKQRLNELKKRRINAKWIFKQKYDKDGKLFAQD